jgi:hypothetical protein
LGIARHLALVKDSECARHEIRHVDSTFTVRGRNSLRLPQTIAVHNVASGLRRTKEGALIHALGVAWIG